MALQSALQDMREMRLRQLHQQNAMKEEAALLGAGSLQGVPEQDLQVTLCFCARRQSVEPKFPKSRGCKVLVYRCTCNLKAYT